MTRSIKASLQLRPTLALLLASVLAAILLAAGAAQADSHEMDEASVKYRQSLMSGVGANMGSIGDILKNRLPLPGHVANHAGQLAESAKMIAAAFKKDVSSGATDAKAKIWQDWAKFEEAIANFEKAAQGLQAAAASGDPAAVGPAMKGLGKSCGGCHKPFRKPKEESYKNK